MKSMGLRWLVLVFLCLAVSPEILTDQIPSAADVGIPERFRTTVVGSLILNAGETRVLRMAQAASRDIDTREAFQGDSIRTESIHWFMNGPAVVVNQGHDTAMIRATHGGKGYIEGIRTFLYRDRSSGEEKKGYLIQTWILVVKPEGQTVESPTEKPLHLSAQTPLPDIPRAVISGRAVMRDTREGVSGAYIELIGDRAGTLQTGKTTGADGRFSLTLDNVLSVDRYEVFLRKPAGPEEARNPESFKKDLWPIHKYYVSINHDNADHVNVGIIEMASVSGLWGGTGAYDRPAVEVTPKPAPPPAGGPGAPPGGDTQPTGFGRPPQFEEGAGAPRIFTASDPDAPPGDPAGQAGDEAAAATVPTTQVDYKGHAEVDFYIKATLVLKFRGRDVTGELYSPMISGQNVRLPGHRMQLTGRLKGDWEDGGEISGTCQGHILWPGGQPEERAGQFSIRKVGKEIHFRSTNFYYNRYIFGARGIRYAPPPDVDPAGVGPAPGAGLFANSIVILIDASGSMRGTKLANAKATANRQIAGLSPDTELAVIAFSGNGVRFPFETMTSDAKERAQKVVESITAGGGTPLAAAIRDAGGYMRKNARGRRLSLIILSDGEETAGGNPPEEVRRLNDLTVKW